MKEIVAVLGQRGEGKFRKAIEELKKQGFTYNAVEKRWSIFVMDDRAEWHVKQLIQAGIQAYIKGDTHGH